MSVCRHARTFGFMAYSTLGLPPVSSSIGATQP